MNDPHYGKTPEQLAEMQARVDAYERAEAEDFLGVKEVGANLLLDDLKGFIKRASAGAARSQQRQLGPSEVGHPCDRKIAMGLMLEKGGNSKGDPLPSIMGTAAHSWMETAARLDNERLGRIRWITEQKVGTRLPGTCDLYDMDTFSVTDWKFPGPTAFAKAVKYGPSLVYKKQAHIYGFGYEELGFPVRNVSICFIPRAAQLSKAKLWMEPYNRQIALDAFARLDRLAVLCADLDVENHPENYRKIEPCPSDDCRLCNYYSPDPQGPLDCGGE